jgi:hypothetical protein
MPPQRLEFGLGAPDYPILNSFMRCRARVSIVRGPLGSGKTLGCIQRLLQQMIEQQPGRHNGRPERRTRWLAVRNTYRDLQDTTIKDFLIVFDGLGQMRYGDTPEFDVRFALPDGTHVVAEVIFLALDRPEHVRKLKGFQITGVWFNEACEIPKALVDMADLRHGRYPSEASGGVRATWHGMFGDTNSYDVRHWMYRLEQARPDDWVFFHQPGGLVDTGTVDMNGRKVWRENPHAENLRNLPDGYYVRGQGGKTDAWIAVFLANEFGFAVNGKPVHPQYIDSIHCAKELLEPDRRYPLLLGFDFGRTPACSIGQFLEHIGRHVALDELCSDDMSAVLFAPEVKRLLERRYSGMKVLAFGDPAGDAKGQATEDTPIRIVRAAGIPIHAAPSNVAVLRRAALDQPLTRICMDSRPAYLLSPRCERLRQALMGGYHYRELQVSGTEPRYSDEPEKNDASHIAEAEEYRLLGGGEGRNALTPPGHHRRGPRQTEAICD